VTAKDRQPDKPKKQPNTGRAGKGPGSKGAQQAKRLLGRKPGPGGGYGQGPPDPPKGGK
jgi:hypothetical protein